MNNFKCLMVIFLFGGMLDGIYLGLCWKAVPANQAMYALRHDFEWIESNSTVKMLDVHLPRTTLSFTYKFGWCRPDVITSHFLRKSYNLTLPTLKDQSTNYIYIMEDKHTRRFASQCVIMKAYVNRKFMFFKSRLPLYYCQGIVLILQMSTVDRQAIHEFYLYRNLDLPVNFVFEFYQAPML